MFRQGQMGVCFSIKYRPFKHYNALLSKYWVVSLKLLWDQASEKYFQSWILILIKSVWICYMQQFNNHNYFWKNLKDRLLMKWIFQIFSLSGLNFQWAWILLTKSLLLCYLNFVKENHKPKKYNSKPKIMQNLIFKCIF